MGREWKLNQIEMPGSGPVRKGKREGGLHQLQTGRPRLDSWALFLVNLLRSSFNSIYCYCVPRIGRGTCGRYSLCAAIKKHLRGVISTPRVAVPRRSECCADTCRKLRGHRDCRPGLVAKVCITDREEAEAGGLRVKACLGY